MGWLPSIWAQVDMGEDALAEALPDLGFVAYFVLGGYLLLLLLLGIAGWLKSQNNEEDYYLSGRSQGWLVSSLTIMATFFSSYALLGAPGLVYRDGVVFALFSLNVPVAGVFVYLVGARIWRAGREFGFVTPADMASDYYDSKVLLRLLIAAAGFLYAIPYVVMQIQAGGLMAEVLFGTAPPGEFDEAAFRNGAIALATITTVYIMIGGMRSVAWTDLIQGMLLISGMLIGGLAMFLMFGGPSRFGQEVMEELPSSSLTLPGNTGQFSWPRLLTICAITSIGSMVQPAQWMRFYAASGIGVLKRAAVIFTVVLTSCFILGVMLIGLAGQVLYPLTFSVTQEIDGGPAEVFIPGDLARHFSYQAAEGGESATLTWTWQGTHREMGETVADRLRRLHASPSFQYGVEELVYKVGDREYVESVQPNSSVPDYNSILVVVLKNELPRRTTIGPIAGTIFAALIIVAIMAASMSTADSNLHALSAVATRDLYDRFLRPAAREWERVWVGRVIILLATVAALVLVIRGRDPSLKDKYDFMQMIAKMGLMAIAFSSQLLPIAIDMCFLRKGTGWGAVAGLAAGLLGAILLGPLFIVSVDYLTASQPSFWLTGMLQNLQATFADWKTAIPIETAAWGLAFNIPVFVAVSWLTKPVDAEKRQEYAEVMAGRKR